MCRPNDFRSSDQGIDRASFGVALRRNEPVAIRSLDFWDDFNLCINSFGYLECISPSSNVNRSAFQNTDLGCLELLRTCLTAYHTRVRLWQLCCRWFCRVLVSCVCSCVFSGDWRVFIWIKLLKPIEVCKLQQRFFLLHRCCVG